MSKYISFVLVLIFTFNVKADDENLAANQWLVDFTKSKLVSAKMVLEKKGERWNSDELTVITYDFASSDYHFVYELNCSENWDVLTSDGTEKPPSMEKKFTSSKVTAWSNFKGIGTYTESYERTVPNWQNFDQLAGMLLAIGKFNYEAPLNGLFRLDEMKILKKLYKSENLSCAPYWRQLDFDKKGNILGIASEYLSTRLEESAGNSVEVMNEVGAELRFEHVPVKNNEIVSGVRISSEKNELVVFNRALNTMLFKFAPQVFSDPDVILTEYLMSVQQKSGKQMQRFASNLAVHE